MKKDKEELKNWMVENNITEDDLDFMWDFCSNFNHPIIKNLKIHDISWKNLNITCIKQIPEIYDKIMKRELYTTEE